LFANMHRKIPMKVSFAFSLLCIISNAQGALRGAEPGKHRHEEGHKSTAGNQLYHFTTQINQRDLVKNEAPQGAIFDHDQPIVRYREPHVSSKTIQSINSLLLNMNPVVTNSAEFVQPIATNPPSSAGLAQLQEPQLLSTSFVDVPEPGSASVELSAAEPLLTSTTTPAPAQGPDTSTKMTQIQALVRGSQLSTQPVITPAISTSPEQSVEHKWLTLHNTRRKQLHESNGRSYVPLQWSAGLADSATNYANRLASGFADCHIEHRFQGDSEYGENLACNWGWGPEGSVSAFSEEKVMIKWFEKESNWGYPENGHYTQVGWRASKWVGCAEVFKNLSGGGKCWIQVCRYATPGNCNIDSNNFQCVNAGRLVTMFTSVSTGRVLSDRSAPVCCVNNELPNIQCSMSMHDG
jgi:uncharacterized protein YkwD